MNLPQTAPEFQCLLPLWPPIARMTGLCHLAWLFFFLRSVVLLCCRPVLNSWTEVISLLPRRLGCGSGPPHPTILIPLMTCMTKKPKGKLSHVAHASTFLSPWHRPVVFSTPCRFPPTRRRPSSARAQTTSSSSPPRAFSSFLNDYFLSFIERIFVDLSL